MYLISYLLQVDVDNFPSAECTSEVRITYPTTPAPTTTTVTTRPTPPAPTPPPVICTQPLDIYFAIDTSGSLGSVEFMNEIDFVIQIIDSFTSSNNRYGYLLFANDTTSTELVSDADAVKERLKSTPYRGGSTLFLPALDQIYNNYFTPMNLRPGASRILFFLTDGKSGGNQSEIIQRANMLKTISKVVILTVGFGNADQEQLTLIATDNLNFTFPNINAARAALNNIVRVACPGKLLSTCIWYTEVYFSIVVQMLLIIDCIYSN